MPEINIVHKHPHSLIQGLVPLGCAPALSFGLQKVKKSQSSLFLLLLFIASRNEFWVSMFPKFHVSKVQCFKVYKFMFQSSLRYVLLILLIPEYHSFIYLKVITSTIRQDFKLRSPALKALDYHKNVFVLQLRQRGVVCRETSNECDLPEHCNGDAGTCPPDVHKKNGNPCGELNNPGHCYSGFCPTLNVQCQAIWGYGMLLPLSSYVYILYVHILRDSQQFKTQTDQTICLT